MDKRGSPLDNVTFDSYVIESGPPPVRLRDGNLLFLYNGARECPTGKPDYSRCYAMGWAILDGNDPGRVLARAPADTPLIVPTLPWEIGNATNGDQTPNAVFIDGALRASSSGADTLDAWYGASDTAIGALRITVSSGDGERR